MMLTSMFERKKKPSHVVKTLSKNLDILIKSSSEKQVKKSNVTVVKCLNSMKDLLIGIKDRNKKSSKKRTEPRPQDRHMLAEHAVNMNVFIVLITQMHKMPFESKKNIAFLFNYLFKHESVFQEYVIDNPSIIWTIVAGYRPENKAIAMVSSKMLGECVKNAKLAHLILTSNELWRFLDTYVLLEEFEAQSSAFDVLKSLLTLHPAKSNEFFNQHYEKFFNEFNSLLSSSNYVVRRHASKSMGQVLFVKEHHDIMLRYISEKSNLKIWMNLLRDTSESIQVEAFHVFKIFVGNPNMPDDIKHTLKINGHKIIKFLEKFQENKKVCDENFIDEKRLVIECIKQHMS